MSVRERRCAACGASARTRDRFCIHCGGNHFLRAGQREFAAPTFVCTRCREQIDAGDAWHSREAGKPICGPCKQREETDA